MPTKIEWCDEVWNVVTGCTKISAGCQNCYAEGIIKRFGHGGHKAHGSSPDKRFENVTMHPERGVIPYMWKKPRSVFVCSMGDLFHKSVPFDFIDAVFSVMGTVYRHTYLVLTKRPERLKQYIQFDVDQNEYKPLKNVWLGVSVEDQKTADERIPILLQIPAAKRFLSIEPILEKVNLIDYLPEIDWVIAGCESGPKRRPAKTEWFRSLRDQCQHIDPPAVPFFLKQVNGYINGKSVVVKMPMLDWITWNQKPKENKA